MSDSERPHLDHGPRPPRLVPLGEALAANTAVVRGDVTLGPQVSVWYGAVIRGDCAPITIGRLTNVQDTAVLHADTDVPLTIGAEVTIGHAAVVHGSEVGDRCLIGIGATVLGRSVIGEECIIAAGTVVREGDVIPPRSLVAGVPGKVRRQVTEEELASFSDHVRHYWDLAQGHRGDA